MIELPHGFLSAIFVALIVGAQLRRNALGRPD